LHQCCSYFSTGREIKEIFPERTFQDGRSQRFALCFLLSFITPPFKSFCSNILPVARKEKELSLLCVKKYNNNLKNHFPTSRELSWVPQAQSISWDELRCWRWLSLERLLCRAMAPAPSRAAAS